MITNINAGEEDGGGLKDPTNNNIVKRKRTKRQRLQSAVPFTIVAHSSTSYNTLNSSPATSSDFRVSSTTTEDEDTAHCLILLSKGHDRINVSPINNNNIEEFSSYKFNSKKYIQTSTDDGSSTGTYVYECKTCSRIFSSFQALGGHRASHRKPKINELLDKRKPPPAAYMAFSDEDDQPSPPWKMIKNNSSSSSSLSHQINHPKKSSSKLHECSICGTEFNSGQALGGHMRRHRVANNNNNTTTATITATNTTLSLVPYVPVTTMVVKDHESNNDDHKSRNDGLFLDLDLNLPAPPETTVVAAVNQDQHRESSFKFMTNNQNKQQPAVHLSTTPTLVDCHY